MRSMHFSYLFFTSGRPEIQSKFVKREARTLYKSLLLLDRLFTTFPRVRGSYQVTEQANKSCVGGSMKSHRMKIFIAAVVLLLVGAVAIAQTVHRATYRHGDGMFGERMLS